MTDGKYQPLTGEMDDLPRTLRRERESRERAAREREQMPSAQSSSYGTSEHANSYGSGYPPQAGDLPQATVTRIKVPFFSLMGFFLKAVFAAIPALIVLIAMLYGLGLALQAYFPQLIKMKILISFPG